jgi:hypothetical protein
MRPAALTSAFAIVPLFREARPRRRTLASRQDRDAATLLADF